MLETNASILIMEWNILSEDELNLIASEVIHLLGDTNIICLQGPMGAGKTTFVRHLMGELGSEDEVSSPTYAIINEYRTNHPRWSSVYHMDLFRIKDIEEVRSLPLSDYLDSGHLCVIEWAEIAGEELPSKFHILRFETLANTGRKIVFL
jgi:tRNA threonylcarbamoyladenosine biosynthesis protein TsaE